MRVLLKFLSVLLLTTFLFTSCSKDDDPADNDLFVGTYEGAVSYLKLDDESNSISTDNGYVRVVKIGGDNYNFIFSNDIPNLTNITMQKGDNNTLIFEDGESAIIRITASELYILYTKDGESWTANCNRE